MANQITSPRHNDEPQKLLDALETAKDEHFEALSLSLEYIQMLEAVINDTAQAVGLLRNHISKELTNPLFIRLGMGQLLANDFVHNIQRDIAKMEGKA